MDLNLENREWKKFRIGDLFIATRGKRLIEENRMPGNIQYYSASAINNGLTDFISNPLFIESNSIIVSTFLDAFFVKGRFTASDEITILKNENLNEFNGKFLANSIIANKEKFAFGYKAFTSRIKRQIILLPTTHNGLPDYAFMEEYIKEKERELLSRYKVKIQSAIEVEPIENKEWGEFKLIDLFDFKKGNQNRMEILKTGNIPLISAKKFDNGLKKFVTFYKKVYKGNSLTLNNDGDGGAGISFYQPADYLLDSHVTALYPRENLNKYTLLFISRCITKQRDKFGNNYSINNKRLGSFKLMLPINSQGLPDYKYMNNYIKQIENRKLQEYLDYKKIE